MRDVWERGGKIVMQVSPDGTSVEMKLGADGRLISRRPKQESENTRHEPDIDIAWRDAPRLTAAASRKIKTLHHR